MNRFWFSLIALPALLLCPQVSNARETRHVSLSENLDSTSSFATTIPSSPEDFATLIAASQFEVQLPVIDALGALHTIRLFYFHAYQAPDGTHSWQLAIYADGADILNSPGPGRPVLFGSVPLNFDQTGQAIGDVRVQVTPSWATGATPTPLDITLADYTSLPAPSSVTALSQDGCVGPCSSNAGLDFDGDAADDVAIYRPEFGMWAILKSSTGMTDFIWKQWGLPGDYPMPGDYTGDGKADLVVWRPSEANWYICPSDYDYTCPVTAIVVQFGLPDDRPLRGDYDGDGLLDLAVWRPQGGFIFYKASRTGTIVSKQWGLPGDIPLDAAINR